MRTVRRCSFFLRALVSCVLALAGGIGCQLGGNEPPAQPAAPVLPGQGTGVFTTAHSSFGVALSHYLHRLPEPEQPIEFPHDVHVGKEIACTEYCHESVSEGPVAGLPSVRTCMSCHRTVATNRPRIRQITQMREEGRDFAWKRVFGYPAQSHVRFNHAPHIRAKVECSTCHGNIATQRTAQRNVDMTMGFCVNCHRERKAPDDCLTCHF